ncbi:hypothetical protein C1H46_012143 [Malus baccata]|uniref:OBG-type G domain-containing protein n=1 Tax=Malus baccata TaxID=106549 RepID=A0A540MU25_MALBA|nr:hypothetical protein C1H46_012143 [Malus baccata]
MATLMQKIKDIEDEMARTQKNKATAHHLGLLKAKLAKLRRDLLEPPSKGGGGAGEGFDVTKSGDARVGLVGFPSVGKSTLLNKLTGTFSEVASYEFTTLTCIPGVIVYRGAKIQLLDLPGIIEGAKDGKGRGRQVISTARTCNCILIVLDAIKPITHKRLIEKELEGFGIRLNKEPPNLTFRKKDKGGINFTSTVTNTHLDLETVKAICSEYRIHNADITLRFDAMADDLIDVIEGSRIYMPCIYVVNKIDQITLEELEILDKLPHYCPVSAHLEWNLDGLLEKIWEYLNLTRIYTKPKGMNPDYEDPVILSSKTRTVEDFCERIHKDFIKQFKYALVWGSSAKHKPQRVGKEHLLEDEDVVQIIKKLVHQLSIRRVANQGVKDLEELTYLIGYGVTRFTKDFCLIMGLDCDEPYDLEKFGFVGESSKGNGKVVKGKGGKCGIFTLKVIEFLSVGIPLDLIKPQNVPIFRLRMAVDMLHEVQNV